MGSFHERVAAIQDSSVGQRSGRAHIYFNREFGLDAQPMGLLCCSIAMEYAFTFHRVASQGIDGTRLFHSIVHEHCPIRSRFPLGILTATHGVHPSVYGIEGLKDVFISYLKCDISSSYLSRFRYSSPSQSRSLTAACSGVMSLWGSAISSYLPQLINIRLEPKVCIYLPN